MHCDSSNILEERFFFLGIQWRLRIQLDLPSHPTSLLRTCVTAPHSPQMGAVDCRLSISRATSIPMFLGHFSFSLVSPAPRHCQVRSCHFILRLVAVSCYVLSCPVMSHCFVILSICCSLESNGRRMKKITLFYVMRETRHRTTTRYGFALERRKKVLVQQQTALHACTEMLKFVIRKWAD